MFGESSLFFSATRKLLNYLALFTEYILASDRRKRAGVNNKINVSWIPFSCFCFRFLVLFMLVHCHTVGILLGHLTRIQPLLKLSVEPVLSLIQLLWKRMRIYWIKPIHVLTQAALQELKVSVIASIMIYITTMLYRKHSIPGFGNKLF